MSAGRMAAGFQNHALRRALPQGVINRRYLLLRIGHNPISGTLSSVDRQIWKKQYKPRTYKDQPYLP
jgi:hypothetical protein